MDWNSGFDDRRLQRIIALLFALAGLAERAAAASFPVRFVVLAILHHAEAVAWSLAIDAASASAPRRASRFVPSCTDLASVPVALQDGRADALRLACSFRLLALIVAAWARLLRVAAVAPAAARPAALSAHTCAGRNGRDAALPAPDTS